MWTTTRRSFPTPLRPLAGTALALSVGLLAGCGGGAPQADPAPSASSSTPNASPSPSPSAPATPETTGSADSSVVTAQNPATISVGQVKLGDEGPCPSPVAQGTGCGWSGSGVYSFDPALLRGLQVTAVSPTEVSDQEWIIDLTFDEADTQVISDLSASLVGQQGRLGLLDPDGVVLSGEQVSTPIDTGHVQIGGALTTAERDTIVRLITASAG